ncbi:MAG: hypothetical protein DYH02_14610 [Candidatus Omnitrophica bacterium COP1]|nr:hypothetical protein [Candidatus Omnitrophica bacterium COP1]
MQSGWTGGETASAEMWNIWARRLPAPHFSLYFPRIYFENYCPNAACVFTRNRQDMAARRKK